LSLTSQLYRGELGRWFQHLARRVGPDDRLDVDEGVPDQQIPVGPVRHERRPGMPQRRPRRRPPGQLVQLIEEPAGWADVALGELADPGGGGGGDRTAGRAVADKFLALVGRLAAAEGAILDP
jgi:hypothetical protein